MFTHLTDLLSFDNTVNTAPTQDSQGDLNNTSTSRSSDAYQSDIGGTQSSNVYLVPDQPMEEIPFEVTRTGGIILPPPHGSSVMDNDEEDASSSNAIVNGQQSKEKRGRSLWGGSKSKSGTEDEDSAVAAVPVTQDSDTMSSDAESYGVGKVVGIASVPEKAPASSYRYKPEGGNKKKWLLCMAVLLLIVAIVVPCAVLIPRNNAAQSSTAAASDGDTSGSDTGGDTSGSDTGGDASGGGGATDGTEGGGGDTDEGGVTSTFAPTSAPTVDAALPQECEPTYESLDACLLNEVTADEADGCIDCVFGFLPDNTGPCDVLSAQVCNVLNQCECLSCSDELEDYLDCQSACTLDCSA